MVLAWLEEWLQTEWLDLRVRLTSLTEQFATVSLCGPNVRKLMRELTRGIELSPEAFPHMSMQEGEVAGIPARIARVSFTGAVGFERSEEHTSELQSLMRNSYAVFCLKKKIDKPTISVHAQVDT